MCFHITLSIFFSSFFLSLVFRHGVTFTSTFNQNEENKVDLLSKAFINADFPTLAEPCGNDEIDYQDQHMLTDILCIYNLPKVTPTFEFNYLTMKDSPRGETHSAYYSERIFTCKVSCQGQATQITFLQISTRSKRSCPALIPTTQ